MASRVGPLTEAADRLATWPLNRNNEARAVLQQTRKAGWTADEKVELLRQRWLADARRAPLIADIQGRSASSVWPQLTRLRRDVGDELFMLGQQRMDDAQRAQFISGLERLALPHHASSSKAATSAIQPSTVPAQPRTEGEKFVLSLAAFIQGQIDTQAPTPAPRAPTPPLHSAVESADASACTRLLLQGADVNKLDADRWAPLHLACDLGKPSIVRLLLEHGADTSLQGDGDDCALHYLACSEAAAVQKLEVAELIVGAHMRKGGDINLINDEGRDTSRQGHSV